MEFLNFKCLLVPLSNDLMLPNKPEEWFVLKKTNLLLEHLEEVGNIHLTSKLKNKHKIIEYYNHNRGLIEYEHVVCTLKSKK